MMTNILQKKNFVCADLERNSNKFWTITLYQDHSVKTEWGRVGHSHDELTKSFPSSMAAEKFFNSKIRDKLRVKDGRRDAYTEIEILEDKIITASPINGDLAELAASEIETASPEVKDFVRWLAKVNIHNICSSTTIRYNIVDGTFSTPLGVIGQKTINEAKDLLDQISKFTSVEDKDCIKIIGQYIRRIPQDLGGSNVKINAKSIFGSPELLQKQQDIIDGLEAATSSAQPIKSNEVTERTFNTTLNRLSDDRIIEEINKRFRKHTASSTISNIYQIHIKDINDRFITHGQPIGNIDRLWHGTNPANILSIFQSGLKIPKNYSNGRRFLDGVYFSDRSSMSLKYASYSKRHENNYRYLFLSDVAMGKYYEPGYNYKGLPASYHSCWAEKNQSTSQIIVYNLDQINICYLVEVGD